MRLNSKTRIGIRALYDLALHGQGRQAQAKDVALRQRLPLRALEEVLQDLRRAGLIEAQRGPRGGYGLSRAPAEITVSQIVRALDGPVERLLSLDDEISPRRGRRPRRGGAARPGDRVVSAVVPSRTSRAVDVPALVWTDVAGRIAAVLGETTLGDFLGGAAGKSGLKGPTAEAPMYFI